MGELIAPIELGKLERMSDIVCHIGNTYCVRINAHLAKSSLTKRTLFYTEYEYTIGGHTRTSIKRGFDYYLSIESLYRPKDGGDKVFIRINPGDFFLLMETLKDVTNWFRSPKYKNAYATKDGKLIMTSNRPREKTLCGLPMGKSISFEMTLVDEFDPKPGVRITFGGSEFVDITIDGLFNLYGSLMNFNLFIAAQNMVGSVNTPLGTNRINLNDNSKSSPVIMDDNPTPSNTSIIGRKIGGKKTLEDLEGQD